MDATQQPIKPFCANLVCHVDIMLCPITLSVLFCKSYRSLSKEKFVFYYLIQRENAVVLLSKLARAWFGAQVGTNF